MPALGNQRPLHSVVKRLHLLDICIYSFLLLCAFYVCVALCTSCLTGRGVAHKNWRQPVIDCNAMQCGSLLPRSPRYMTGWWFSYIWQCLHIVCSCRLAFACIPAQCILIALPYSSMHRCTGNTPSIHVHVYMYMYIYSLLLYNISLQLRPLPLLACDMQSTIAKFAGTLYIAIISPRRPTASTPIPSWATYHAFYIYATFSQNLCLLIVFLVFVVVVLLNEGIKTKTQRYEKWYLMVLYGFRDVWQQQQ